MRMSLIRNIHRLKKFQCHRVSCRTLFGFSRPDDWNKAVTDAEKVVGYPTSFMSLRCLLSDELSNVAIHMRKLVGTKHPLLKTARGLVYDGTHNLQTRGLIVLLISKTAGLSQNNFHQQQDVIEGILPSQRSLAEIAEMIYTANLIHKGVVNLSDIQPSDGSVHDMELGNKMAVLTGDFLLANASTGLAQLHNTKVVETISSCIGDHVSAEFTGLQDKNGRPYLPDNVTFNDWLNQTFLSSGSLLSKSCLAAVELAGHGLEEQTSAFEFGKNMALAQQLSEDLKPFLKPEDNLEQLTITSAPVIKYIASSYNKHPISLFNIYSQKKILEVIKDSSILSESKTLCNEYGEKAINSLSKFKNCQAKNALIKIVKAVVDV
ncbi:hypothetical protein LOTGIDRAFT_209876 [Lottia gigantea]|uniref:Decaprenyl-diphosphate synthase subunit 2 n=1 Tax=Lottia gigantea TaxID=225164 RepID=V4A208_LOTGI|nr:hypothetical protein LOTGIDRAFT_209876 [Lottia gigantea]ESO88955.1 hypothetical protein LOTGIDRAFT_209876 [Lottia gigantea]